MKPLLSLLLVALLISSCRPLLTSKNGTPPPFKRVLVVSKLTRISKDYLPQFAITFPTSYTICTVDAGTLSFGDPDSLVRQMAEKCDVDAVLTLSQGKDNGIRRGIFFYRNVHDIVLEMATYPGGKPFWKGLSHARVYEINPISPQKVVRRLYDEDIIQGKPTIY
jgi:hypothetical protein